MKRILLSAILLLTAAVGFSSLPGCEVHETDRVVYDHHGHPDWDHHDYDHHDYDHHEEIHHDDYHAEEH